MTAFDLLFFLTLAGCAGQILTRDRRRFEYQSTRGVAVSVFTYVMLMLLWFVRGGGFPETNTWCMTLSVLVIITTVINGAKLYTFVYSLATLCVGALIYGSAGYSVKSTPEGKIVFYHSASYWMTGQPIAEGVEAMNEKVISARGRYEDSASESEVFVLKDAEGNIYINNVCDYSDHFKKYEIMYHNDDSSTVHVVKLIREDGSCEILDFKGERTTAEGYSIPTYDDGIDIEVI